MAGDLADFKARLRVVDIVQRYVRLTRHGPLHKGLCPFHREKTPSFTVTASRGTYHCFGCGAHGNALDFLMAIEGLSFAEAVRRAADLTGLEPPVSEAHRPETDRKRALSELLEAAARRFRARLDAADGSPVRAYLARRGLSPATIARFELGYAGGGRAALTEALTATGVAVGDLVDAGLSIVPEDGGAPYDRFRERLMFPIRDGRGRLVGFGGRALADGAKAKYLNSPEGPLFQKRELLYGAPGLDRRVGRGRVHVVEGYMDVIALAQHGVAAVAPLGTAMTEAQLERLWRLDDAPLVCLDGDAAGLAAAGRLAERALAVLQPGRSLAFALLPAGED
ncbi:MAG: DNA primase, partial [Alphaproteobacteria bacterium]